MSKPAHYFLLVGLCSLMPITAVYAFSPNNDASLVGWWKLDDGTGTTALDSSGKGNTGTLTGGPTWVAGHLKGALEFNGTSQYVECGNGASLNVTAQVTLSAWIYPTAAGNGAHQHFVTKGDYCYALKHNTGNYMEFNIYDGTWYTARGQVVTSAAFNNVWHHVAGTYDGTTLKMYVDGALQPTFGAEAHVGVIANSTTTVTLARDNSTSARYFTGMMDDARIYSRTLTDGEVLAVMKGAEDGPATNPKPDDKAADLPRETVLSWTPGPFGGTHNVYFGTNPEDVNTATTTNPLGVLVSPSQDANTYDPPGRLEFGQTYYWRVDEVNATADHTVYKGGLWQFTVEPFAYAVLAQNITATASSMVAVSNVQNTINGSGVTGDLHGTTSSTMWTSGTNAPQPVWLKYDFDRAYKLYQMLVWNYNMDYETMLNFGLKDVTIEYSSDGTTFTKLGDFVFAQADSAPDYKYNTVVDFGGVAVRSVKLTAKSNYGGKQYGLSELRFLYIPVQVREPTPAVGATGISPDVVLGWRAGREAAAHQVYLGTDPNALPLAGSVAATSYATSGLSLSAKYYWRVDEVNAAEAISTWAGDVWNFTTSPFIVVDDMENYNDTTNKIFDIWVDGYNTLTNGSVVGVNDALTTGTFGSTAIYHAGKQSMPLAYGRDGITNSEATRTFTPVLDWTKSGVQTLALYFYGQATNATNVPLWIKLTDQNGKSAKVSFGAAAGEDAAVLADPAWTTWNIPLSSFSGISLSKVQSMTIGLGTGTGAGTLYIDDIQLYPPTTATTVTRTLIGWWKLDNDVKDSSGNGNNGTIVGTPTYVAAGKIGASLKLNGTADYVDCGTAAIFDITDQVTLSAWIKPANFANSAYQTFISKGDNAYVLAHTNGNRLQLAIYDGTWYSASSEVVASTMNSTWHHVAGTYDGTQIRLYLNGAMVASTLRTGVIATNTYQLSLGRNSQNTGRAFNGELDDARVYHGVLPTSEIKKLANP